MTLLFFGLRLFLPIHAFRPHWAADGGKRAPASLRTASLVVFKRVTM